MSRTDRALDLATRAVLLVGMTIGTALFMRWLWKSPLTTRKASRTVRGRW